MAIDARCLNTAHLRGMGKYVAELLAHIDPEEHLRFTLFGDRPERPFHLSQDGTHRVELFDTKGYRFHTWEQVGLPWRARRERAQVLHCTATTLPYWQSVPTVATVHDTLPWKEVAPTRYDFWYLHHLLPAALRRCRAIITISEASKADITALWPDLAPKLLVVPHGISDQHLAPVDTPLPGQTATFIADRPYLLYVGGALDRKRFSWALEVVAKLGNPRTGLVACGFDEGERRRAGERLSDKLRQQIHFAPFLEEPQLASLYRRAVAVLYPTLYEGFGFPVLEAHAAGTPVLFSPGGSLRELQGPAAEILPPHDMSAWIETVQRLLAERANGGRSNEAAKSWARGFSWTVSAARHIEIYRKAVLPA